MGTLAYTNLPNEGVVSYGGWQFPPTTYTASVEAVPEWDRAKRTVIFSRVRISLQAYLTGTAIGDATRAVVQVLNRPAMPFIYAGHGYNFAVNTGAYRDVQWGPKPSARLEIIGPHASLLHFTVEVCVPDFPGARMARAPMELGFTVHYDRDEAGYTTRRVHGWLRIPMSRNGPNDRRLPDNIDAYLEDVYPGLIEGFRRTTKTWEINAAKDGAEFHVVDEQMPPNVPPPGVVYATARHDCQSTPGKMTEWNGSFDATYEIARNGVATVAAARDNFFSLLKDRIRHAIDTVSRMEPVVQSGGGRTSVVAIPVSFRMSEPDIFGRTTVQYAMQYKVVGASLRSMLQGSGQWRPSPGSDWRKWATSLGPVLGPRGHAGLAFSLTDDRIVDLFQPGPPSSTIGTVPPRRGQNFSTIPRDVFPEPSAEGSYIYFRNGLFLETDSGVVEIRTLPTEPRAAAGDVYGGPTVGGGVAAGAIGAAVGTIAGAFPGVWANTDFFFPPPRTAEQQKKGGMQKKQPPQRRARQGGVLFMRGEALRARFAVPCPSVERWGAATLTPANRRDMGEGFWSAVVGNAVWPIHYGRWNLRFILDEVPAGSPPALPNPLLGGGGVDAASLGPTVGDPLQGIQAGQAVAGAIGGAVAAALPDWFGN